MTPRGNSAHNVRNTGRHHASSKRSVLLKVHIYITLYKNSIYLDSQGPPNPTKGVLRARRTQGPPSKRKAATSTGHRACVEPSSPPQGARPAPSWTHRRPSGRGDRVPVVVAVSLTQGQRQGQARLPAQLLLLQAALRGPGLEEVRDVANLGGRRELPGAGDCPAPAPGKAAGVRKGLWGGRPAQEGRGSQGSGRCGEGQAQELTVRPATSAPCRRPTRTSLQWCLWSDTRV